MKRSIQKTDVFLIHAHSDRETVHKLYQRLVRDGLKVWLDAERLQPGQDWQNEIRAALLKCGTVLVCLTNAFNNPPGFRHEELKLALEKANFVPEDQIFVIPVRLDECEMPESLQHLHRVDLFKPGGYAKLLRVLQR